MMEDQINNLEDKIDELNRKVNFICSTLPQNYMIFADHRPVKQFECEDDARRWLDKQFDKSGKILNKSVIKSYWGAPRIESVAKGLYKPWYSECTDGQLEG